MIEAYFKITPDTPAAELCNAFDKHTAIFKKHVTVVRKLLGDLLRVDPDAVSLTVLQDPVKGIQAFIFDDWQAEILAFNTACGQVFKPVYNESDDSKKPVAFTWDKESKDPICEQLNDVIPAVKSPPTSLLWPLIGRESGSFCQGPNGPVMGPGIMVDDGRVQYVIGNECTLFGEDGRLETMEGVVLADPIEMMKEIITKYNQEAEKINNEMYKEMTFGEAASFIMPMGKYERKNIDEIATTDLQYLVWLYEERLKDEEDEPIDVALAVYMEDPTIAADWKK